LDTYGKYVLNIFLKVFVGRRLESGGISSTIELILVVKRD
jgi:hypothetical protein